MPDPLLERFVTGDQEAFEQLFHQFQPEVYRWVVRLIRNPAAAEDVTIEAFWRIYRAHARFDPSRSFGAWARRIASNAAVDYLRQTSRERLAFVPPDAGPADSSARRDVDRRVERAFLTLRPKLRVVAELALVEGWLQQDIATALGISTSAVKARAFRATKLLRDALRREGIEP